MSHPQEAADFFERIPSQSKWHDDTLWVYPNKRDKNEPYRSPEWKSVAELASSIKDNVLWNLG